MNNADLEAVEDTRSKATFWAILVTGLAAFMAGLDNLVITTALPTIREDLGGSLSDLEWTVNAYTLTFAVLMLLGAAIGDRFGRRKIFVVGLAIFTLSSAAAALAPSINGLIAARAVQGVGAAIIMPLTITLLMAAVPADKRGMAMGIYGAITGVAIAGGPVVSGVLVDSLSWHWIFWLNVPIGVLLAPLAYRKLDESRGRDARLDVVGTILVSVAMVAIVLGLIRGNEDGWTSGVVLTGLIGGVVLLGVFAAWENRTPEPMLPLRMFRNRAFTGLNIATLTMCLGIFGIIFLFTQFLQTVQGYSALEAGVRTLAWTAVPMVAAPVAGIVSDKIGGKPVVLTGLVLQMIAMIYWALVITPTVSYVTQLPVFILAGAGMGMFLAPLTNVLMGSVRTDQQGIASGVNSVARELGAAIGVAALAAIFSSFGGYGSGQNFVDGMVPALWTCAIAMGVAIVAMLLVPNTRPDADPVHADADSVQLDTNPINADAELPEPARAH
jgi:EmrB/QacA subfamily drug resistance transporter